MEKQFGLELQVDKVGDHAIDKVRNNAFLYCAPDIDSRKGRQLCEQFQE